jgi:Trk K+ transport system NAD-binding subunit
MKQSILTELKQHLIATVKDIYSEDDTDFSELHNKAFNEDYYIIGYYQASEWLKQHEVDAFDAIAYVAKKDTEEFGSCYLTHEDFNSERIVNLLAYHAGYEVMPSCNLENITKEELLTLLERD